MNFGEFLLCYAANYSEANEKFTIESEFRYGHSQFTGLIEMQGISFEVSLFSVEKFYELFVKYLLNKLFTESSYIKDNCSDFSSFWKWDRIIASQLISSD